MSKVPITMAFSKSARTRPILDGEIEIEGVDLNPCVISPGDLFWRQLKNAEFDLSELSLSSLLMMKSAGTAQFSALPCFPSRAFFHTASVVHSASGIERPEDLRGKRVGLPEYQMTAALWIRGALAHEFGVQPSDIEWHMARPLERSHAGTTGFTTPEGVTIVPTPAGRTLGQMLLDGEIDALMPYVTKDGGLGLGQEDERHPSQMTGGHVDHEIVDPMDSPDVHWLFPDPRAEGQRYFESTGIFPFNHIVALRDSLIEKHPWLARNVYDAFEEARVLAANRLRIQLEPYEGLGSVNTAEVLAVDSAMTYGFAANRSSIEAAMRFSNEQGLSGNHLTPEDVFASSLVTL
jgi:4,5-dihydroxyphthalate decarboxylase